MRCVTSVALLAVMAAPALAQQEPRLWVDGAWARPQADVARPSAAYARLVNHGSDTIVIRRIGCSPAGRAEIHETVTENGMVRMRQVARLSVAPGDTASLRPGGMHVMLMALRTPLVAGQTFTCTLFVRGGGHVDAEFTVRAP